MRPARPERLQSLYLGEMVAVAQSFAEGSSCRSSLPSEPLREGWRSGGVWDDFRNWWESAFALPGFGATAFAWLAAP